MKQQHMMDKGNFVEIQIRVSADSLYPDMRAESARHKKAKKETLMAPIEESANTLSDSTPLNLCVIGIADDTDDINRYVTT